MFYPKSTQKERYVSIAPYFESDRYTANELVLAILTGDPNKPAYTQPTLQIIELAKADGHAHTFLGEDVKNIAHKNYYWLIELNIRPEQYTKLIDEYHDQFGSDESTYQAGWLLHALRPYIVSCIHQATKQKITQDDFYLAKLHAEPTLTAKP